MVPVGEQFTSFFFTIIIGFVLGVLIDAYRSFHRLSRPRPIAITLGDFFLWLFLALLVFFLLLLNNWGEVRGYVLLGMGFGFIFYHLWFSRIIQLFWYKFFFLIGKIFRYAYSVLLFPFVLVKKLLFIPLGLISMFLDWLWRLSLGVTRGIRFGIEKRLRGVKRWFFNKRKKGG